MSKLIALKSGSYEILDDAWNSDFSNLKQQALFFDQIGIYKLSNFCKALIETQDLLKKLAPNFSTTKAETVITELEWLQQNGIIFELKLEEELSNLHLNLLKTSSGQNFESAQNLLRKVIEIQTIDLKNVVDEKHKIELIKEQQVTILRLLSVVMETTREVTTVTTLPYMEYARELPNSSKSNVYQIAIHNLPLPNNETPWEKIIDYRNDPESQKHLLQLRRWIRKFSSEDQSPGEIQEEFDWLINEFQAHMNLHKMKANMETLEVVIKSPLKFLELEFSKIAEPLFALKKRQINLMEAELNAPGREMAYIIKTRDAFQSQE